MVTVAIPSGVTSIGDAAFYYCVKLASVTLPESLTTIGKEAFYYCPLTSVTIPKSVTSIGDKAFCFSGNDTTIKDIYVEAMTPPSAVSGSFAWDCYRYATLHIPYGSRKEYASVDPWSKFMNVMEEGAPDDGFVHFVSTEAMKICLANWDTNGDGQFSKEEAAAVTDIGEKFKQSNITSFNELQYFTGLTEIPNYAFRSSNITSVIIPNGVKKIGSQAFYFCTSLASLTIGSSVASISFSAFEDCRALASIKVESGNATYDSRGDCNALIQTSTNELILGSANTVIPDGVTSIGNYAFSRRKGLTSINIPSSVTTIGGFSFEYCDNLTSVTIPRSVTSIGQLWSEKRNPFQGCGSLKTITVESGNPVYDSRGGCNAIIETASNTLITGSLNTVIPGTVKTIGHSAFRNLGLSSIVIPGSVTAIGEEAFCACNGLTSIDIPNSVKSIDSEAFLVCRNLADFTIPASVTNIGAHVFSETAWYNQQPDGQLYKDGVFLGTKGNTKPSGAQSVKSGTRLIAGGVFETPYYSTGNEGVTSVSIPSTVTAISDEAFYYCKGLTSVTVPNSVNAIGKGAFSGCSNLTTVTLPSGLKGISDELFYYCSSLTSVNIPSGVTVIGSYAFCDCSSLTALDIPAGVTSIGSGAFLNCKKVTSFDIPRGVTAIESSTFSGCDGLTSITIPARVKSIGSSAFYYCSNLASVTSLIRNPMQIDSYVFYNIARPNTLYVPKGTKSKYQALNYWRYSFNNIVEIDVENEPGDVNGDNVVDVADIASVISVMASSTAPQSSTAPNPADVNGDGVVDVADIATIISEMAAQARMQEETTE